MPCPRRTPFLVALLLPSLALAACGGGSDDASSSPSDAAADESSTTTSTTEAAARTGKGTFVVGDRTYAFDAKRCTAEKGDPAGTILAEGTGTFDGRPFTVTVKSSPDKSSAIETVQVVFAATEAVVGTNFVQLPAGAADVKLQVSEDGKATGTIAVMGTGGQPSGEGTLTLTCDAA
jgi:hypothetical protein